jgi:hypothetical protein
MPRKFTDNAATTLAQALLIAGTTLTVQAGKGDNFPAVVRPRRRRIGARLLRHHARGCRRQPREDQGRAARRRRAMLLGSVGYPLVRGYDGTVARAWNAGDIVDLRVDKSR